jgi:hypothetical protein
MGHPARWAERRMRDLLRCLLLDLVDRTRSSTNLHDDEWLFDTLQEAEQTPK